VLCESEEAATVARQAEKADQCTAIQAMAAFKEKEREDLFHRVKREIVILDELNASSISSCETDLPGRRIFWGRHRYHIL
jgi:hypothetical protein